MRDFTEYSANLWTPGQMKQGVPTLPTPVFHLEDSDRTSPTWLKLMAHYQVRLHSMRERNEGDMDEKIRAKLLGQILEIKELLLLNQAPRETPRDDQAF